MANSAKCGVNRRIAAESSTGYAGTPGAPKSGRVNRAVAGIGPDSAVTDLHAILEVAAIAHGEWVRIQPLANGNGRIARLWVNWVAVRYGLPFFLALKPRPSDLVYAAAAAASMRGDHHPMVVSILTLLNQHI